ncbi:GNAT family N-acetyltransferase [Pedobacter sp. KR3-3]|uniref:GNAT family N-acetyltransferase n=1 Tax=Pedobacter albus TaxID=3113905 RepID=A0ABU7I7Z8_9SPHI|nr:GNAT family N-acetyltransferase [Pedobacter sp. KR3-3]MEE1945600.1 GNAT family N-acetyltransferase [Pedobacter sp. KR3-3]
MEITYKIDSVPTPQQIIQLYNDAGLPRPTHDLERIKKMYESSNLIVSAWDDEVLVGAARSITDWCWSCYLADLAIKQTHQKEGIGRKLVDLTKAQIGEETMLLLLSVPTAMEYYPKVGFAKQESSFIINRER